MAACVFEGGSSHPTMLCWRGLLYSCTVQMDKWRAILHKKQAIVLPQYRKRLQVKGLIVNFILHTAVKSVHQTVNIYSTVYSTAIQLQLI